MRCAQHLAQLNAGDGTCAPQLGQHLPKPPLPEPRLDHGRTFGFGQRRKLRLEPFEVVGCGLAVLELEDKFARFVAAPNPPEERSYALELKVRVVDLAEEHID